MSTDHRKAMNMTEENIKLEEALGNAQAVVPDEPVTEVPAEAPAAEAVTETAPTEEKTAEAPAEEKTAEAPAEEKTVEAPAEEKTVEAPAEEKKEEQPKEKKIEQLKEKKEKKPCRLVAFFANAKNAGNLIMKCFLMLLISLVLAYAGLMIWGYIDKQVPTFFTAAYWAVGTAGAFLLVGIILIVVMIVRFAKANKKK